MSVTEGSFWRRAWVRYAGVFIVALAARLGLAIVTRSLVSVGSYDEGVYYAIGRLVWHGQLPYRDVTFLHPTGIVWLASPAGWLGALAGDHVGLAAARLGDIVLGSACAVGVAWACRRWGALASVGAGLVFALWRPEIVTDRILTLEVPLNAAIVGALVLVDQLAVRLGASGVGSDGDGAKPRAATAAADRRHSGGGSDAAAVAMAVDGSTGRRGRWAAGRSGRSGDRSQTTATRLAGLGLGIVLGCALAIKVWAAGPALVIGLWAWRAGGWKVAARLVAGAAGALVVLVGPFVAAAPVDAVRQIVVAQMGRPAQAAAWRNRLGPLDALPDAARLGLLALAAVGLVALAVWRLWRSGPMAALGWCWVGAGLAAAGELAISPSYWAHYLAFLTPFLAAGAGAALGWMTAARRHLAWRIAVPVVVGVGVLGALGFTVTRLPHWTAFPSDGAQMRALIDPSMGCVWARHPSYLIAADALDSDIEAGCAVDLDPYGMTMMAEAGLPYPEAAARPGAAVAEIVRPGLDAASWAVVESATYFYGFSDLLHQREAADDGAGLVGMVGDLEVWRLEPR